MHRNGGRIGGYNRPELLGVHNDGIGLAPAPHFIRVHLSPPNHRQGVVHGQDHSHPTPDPSQDPVVDARDHLGLKVDHVGLGTRHRSPERDHGGQQLA